MNMRPPSIAGDPSKSAGRSGAGESRGTDPAALDMLPTPAALDAELRRFQQQLDEARSEVLAARDEYRKACERSEHSEAVAREQVGALRGELESLAAELEDGILARDAEIARLTAEIERLTGALRTLRNEAARRLRKLRAESRERLENARGEAAEQLEIERSSAEERIEALRAEAAETAERREKLLAQREKELARRDLQLTRLAADVETYARDRVVNAAEMAGTTAREMAALRQQIATLKEEKEAVWTHLNGILNSNSWKATLPFQQFARRHPRLGRTLKGIGKGAAGLFGLRRYTKPVEAERAEWKEQFTTAHRVGDGNRIHRIPPAPRWPLPLGADAEVEGAEQWPVDRPLVSVVIPCFNYGHFISDAIESVLAQTLKDVEIIVVEGGSSSLESREQVARLNYPRTRVFMRAAPARVGANRDFGIEQARGRYVCCLDADDKLDPTYLEKMVFLLEECGYDVAGAAARFFGKRSDGFGHLEHPTLADLIETNHVPTCAVFRKELWRKVGGIYDFTEPEGHVHEDWAFWQRLAGFGARFVNVRDYLFLYRSHGASLSQVNVMTEARMREIVTEYNADVISPNTISHSSEIAREERWPAVPLRNLLRHRALAKDEPRTVLLAMPFTILGGAERLLSGVVRHLTASGWKVVLVTTIDPGYNHGDTTDWFREGTPEIYHLPRFLSRLDRWEPFIRYLIEAKQVDVLWIAGSAFLYDMLPELKARYPELAIVDLLFNLIGHTRNNRKHASRIDLNLVENEELQEWLLTRGGESRRRVRVIKSGVDISLYRPRTAKTQSVVNALNIAPGTIVVGFSGRWSEEKDPVGYIEIASRVTAPNVTFLMTGTGHMRPQIEAAIARAGFAPGRFHLLGEVPEVEPYLGVYDLLCLPSKFDGRPVVVLESLASGIPVLASSVGGLPELVRDGVNGKLFQAGDYDAFAAAIDRLAADPEALATMKSEAREFAERELDSRRMHSEYADALLWAAEEAQTRADVASKPPRLLARRAVEKPAREDETSSSVR